MLKEVVLPMSYITGKERHRTKEVILTITDSRSPDVFGYRSCVKCSGTGLRECFYCSGAGCSNCQDISVQQGEIVAFAAGVSPCLFCLDGVATCRICHNLRPLDRTRVCHTCQVSLISNLY